MGRRFYICDVFTAARFSGNQLAVLPNADGLSDRQMQQIAREFQFSESAFVLRPRSGHTRQVRIFTPVAEVPFAGHPNIGTAFVLASTGEFGPIDSTVTVTFEEKAGPVPVTIERRADGALWCELAAPEPLTTGPAVPAAVLASAVSLAEGDLLTGTHPPQMASVGLPFLVAEVANQGALARAAGRREAAAALAAAGLVPDIYLYTRSSGDAAIRARMFAPLDGIAEDPATGSAACALAAMLARYHPAPDGSFRWRIAQGVEMGRPSLLEARAEKRAGAVLSSHVAGTAVLVAEGVLHVD
jgi:trans-2,3-dihydro-3-hydroxyanthranilate isomerase